METIFASVASLEDTLNPVNFISNKIQSIIRARLLDSYPDAFDRYFFTIKIVSNFPEEDFFGRVETKFEDITNKFAVSSTNLRSNLIAFINKCNSVGISFLIEQEEEKRIYSNFSVPIDNNNILYPKEFKHYTLMYQFWRREPSGKRHLVYNIPLINIQHNIFFGDLENKNDLKIYNRISYQHIYGDKDLKSKIVQHELEMDLSLEDPAENYLKQLERLAKRATQINTDILEEQNRTLENLPSCQFIRFHHSGIRCILNMIQLLNQKKNLLNIDYALPVR